MKLYFNGDSHTIGSELPPNSGFAFKLAKLLNATEVENLAVGGNSNDRIIMTTRESIRKWHTEGGRPDLVIIGFSQFLRMDWYWRGEYMTAPSDLLESQECSVADANRFRYHEKIVKQSGARSFMARYFHERIYNLHIELESYAIPHLFFSAVESFQSAIFKDIHKYLTTDYLNTGAPTALHEYDWNNCFYKPYGYNSSFLEWGRDYGYKSTELFHLEESAHTEFAKLLHLYIQDNYSLS
jgi:hypothetical protein